MIKNSITLSLSSQGLIKELAQHQYSFQNFSLTEISFERFIDWFRTEEQILQGSLAHTKQQKYLISALKASLLKDFCEVNGILHQEENSKPSPLHKKFQFIFLIVTGSILALFDGYIGIVSFLSVIPNFPSIALISIGIAFSALSAIVFYGFNLAAISNNLGIKFKNSPQMIDSYISQIEQIDLIMKFINKELACRKKLKELEELKLLATMLQLRYFALCEEGKKLNAALNSTALKIFKNTITCLTGILFFTGGFFSGQLMTTMIALGFFGTVLAPICWPVLLVSIVFGIGALCGYIWMERPGVEKLVSQIVHLDKDKIAILTDEVTTNSQNAIITNSIGQIDEQIALHTQLKFFDQSRTESLKRTKQTQDCFKRSASLNDLDQTKDLEPLLRMGL